MNHRRGGGIPFCPPLIERRLFSRRIISCFQRPGWLYRFGSISTSYSTSPFSSCTNERRTRVSPAPKETRPIFLSPTTKSQLKKAKNGREEERESSSLQVTNASQGLVWATIRHNKNPSRNLPPHITSFHPKAMYPLHTLSR